MCEYLKRRVVFQITRIPRSQSIVVKGLPINDWGLSIVTCFVYRFFFCQSDISARMMFHRHRRSASVLFNAAARRIIKAIKVDLLRDQNWL